MRSFVRVWWVTALMSIAALPAMAVEQYMILELRPNGSATHEALDLSQAADGAHPVLIHIFLNTPEDHRTAQLLWVAREEPVVWERGGSSNRFDFIPYAVLPDGSTLEYRFFDHQSGIELGALRHQQEDLEFDVRYDMVERLRVGSYRVEGHLIVPGRPRQVVMQRLDVVGVDGGDSPFNSGGGGGNADPDPQPDSHAGIGFTPVDEAQSSRIIYVSDSEGNDANNGLTERTAVQTLARGMQLVRTGRPDWLLLKAGDTWNGQNLDGINLSGASPERPAVIGVYGQGPRPVIIPRHNTHGLRTDSSQINGLVIQGLHIYAATRDPSSRSFVDRDSEIYGINVRIGGNPDKYIESLVIEDCIVTHFDNNILIVDDRARQGAEGEPGRIRCVVRRNIIRFASGTDSHAVGLYIEGSRDSVIEQNLLDHNGWHPAIGVSDRNPRSHNIYAQRFNGPITIRDNIISRGAAHGLQLRAGGDILNNLFVQNALSFYTAINNSRANFNVLLESGDISPDEPRGHGLNGWGMERYEVIGNTIARRIGGLQRPGIEVAADRVVIRNNRIYDWTDRHEGTCIQYSSNDPLVDGNISQEDYNGQEPPYVDPQRGPASYAGTIGLEPTFEAFIDAAASRPRGVWDPALDPATVCEYIREGFRLQQ